MQTAKSIKNGYKKSKGSLWKVNISYDQVYMIKYMTVGPFLFFFKGWIYGLGRFGILARTSVPQLSPKYPAPLESNARRVAKWAEIKYI